MPKPEIERTHPLIWCLAFICIVLTVGVIIAGMVVFIGYLAYKPKEPSVSISYAHLDAFSFDPAGVLSTKLTIVIDAENDNERTASFYDFRFFLTLAGMEVARLKADPFPVPKNKTVSLNYVVDVSQIPMDPRRKNAAESYLKLHLAISNGWKQHWPTVYLRLLIAERARHYLLFLFIPPRFSSISSF